MGFSRTAIADGDDVLIAPKIITVGKIHDEHLVQAGHGLEVEAVEALCRWE